MVKSKSKSEGKIDKNKNEVITYASKEEEDEFLKFSDDEMDCLSDVSEDEETTENVPRACDLNMSDDEDNDDESVEEDGIEEEDNEIEDENVDGEVDESLQPFDRKASREQMKVYSERNSRTLFVGNITNKTTKKVLQQLFNSKKGAGEGSVETIRIRGAVSEDHSLNSNAKRRAIILNKFSNENQVLCAFVVLKTKDDVEKCLKLNGHSVDGRHIRVDRVKGKKMQFKENNCIFIGNLPYSVNEEIIRESFEKCGEIVNVRLVRNKSDGAIKGIGFVEFTENLGVEFALKLGGKLKIENRVIRIQKWNPSQTQGGKRKEPEIKTNFKRPRVVAPTNKQGVELEEFILSKKKKMLKKTEKKKKFVKAIREKKSKKE